jgi:hypothetical protein
LRLWSLHPKYLDRKGLVALWREGLLAQKVLLGNTKGYKNHPQLYRFKTAHQPLNALGAFLLEILKEAESRGYTFDASKIIISHYGKKLTVTDGQLEFEWKHLLAKLKMRAREKYQENHAIPFPFPHPLFIISKGKKENWEKG